MKTLAHRHRPAPAAGFSLAEMMVVIVIIGLLATLVVPNVMRNLFRANRAVATSDINAIAQSLDNYAIEHGGKYPDTLEVLVTPDETGMTYLKGRKSVPRDPWKNEYRYQPPQGGREYLIISYGKDGQPGGQGEDADLDNQTIAEGNR